MPFKPPPFQLYFEIFFLESYEVLSFKDQKAIDKALEYLASNPRHPTLNVHTAKNVKAKYQTGGDDKGS
jgi:hypothetical protein